VKNMFKLPWLLILLCSEFVVKINWTRHASERFWERALIYGFSKTDFERVIKKQEVRVDCGFDGRYKKQKYETIGMVGGKLFTIQKAESPGEIVVITFWESNKGEVDLWLSKKK